MTTCWDTHTLHFAKTAEVGWCLRVLRKCISWKRQDNIEESSTERNKEKRIKKNVNNPISYGISSSTTKKIEREGRERDFVLKDINSNRANIKKANRDSK